MPCRCDGWEEEENERMHKLMDKLTRMLCTASKAMDNRGVKMSNEHLEWWKQHQEFDRKRAEQEKKERQEELLRKRAIAKLTPEERKLLDI